MSAWSADLDAPYQHAPGLAARAFLEALRDRGALLASVCARCQVRRLPPQAFCEACFEPAAAYGEAGPVGELGLVTVLRRDPQGAPLEPPEVRALVRFPGVEGGLLHRVAMEPARAVPGLRVRPLLALPEERRGSILDILGFVPA